jgi:hypothetical protein
MILFGDISNDAPDPRLPSILSSVPRTYGGNAAFHNFHNDYSHIQDPNLRRRLALAEVRRSLLSRPHYLQPYETKLTNVIID